jgi:glycerate kinase
MRVVVAPDSFKGTLTQADAAAAMVRGLHRARPDWLVIEKPMADGGEGTLAVLHQARGGQWRATRAEDAYGRVREARWLELDDGTACIEAAAGPGYVEPKARPRPARFAHSRGLGQLMAAAVNAGARRLVVTLGGTGSTDGGMGALQVLGARFDVEADPGADALGRVGRLTIPDLAVPLVGWADVLPPLGGPTGAVARYGPQKGIAADEVGELDPAMERWGRLLEATSGRRVVAVPGAGAAGGIGAMLLALGGRLISGGMAVAGAIGLPAALAEADGALTGEGAMDAQSSAGKVVGVVARLARAAGCPAFAVGGQIRAGADRLYAMGLSGLFELVRSPRADERPAASILEERVDQLAPWLDLGPSPRYGYGGREPDEP